MPSGKDEDMKSSKETSHERVILACSRNGCQPEDQGVIISVELGLDTDRHSNIMYQSVEQVCMLQRLQSSGYIEKAGSHDCHVTQF